MVGPLISRGLRCGITRTLALTFWFWAATTMYCVELSHQISVTPVWSADVDQGLSGSRSLGAPFLIDSNRAGIAFVDSQRLLVYEVKLDSNHLSSRQSPEISSSFILHTTVLEAASGRVESSKEWPTRPHESSIHVTGGGILVRTGDVLTIYSREFTQIEKLPLPHPDPYEGWEIRVSPSGRTILFNHYIRHASVGKDFSHFIVIDGSTFKLKNTWSEYPAQDPGGYAVSDLGTAKDRYVDGLCHTITSDFGTQIWTSVWTRRARGCAAVPTYVSNSSFIYGCMGADFSWVSSKGQVLMTDPLGRKEQTCIDYKAAAARDGRYVALSLASVTDLWDTGARMHSMRIAVYNLEQKRLATNVPVIPLPKVDFDFALSPDGSRLAVLNDRLVSVYSVSN